jgi:hypothetical protein
LCFTCNRLRMNKTVLPSWYIAIKLGVGSIFI